MKTNIETTVTPTGLTSATGTTVPKVDSILDAPIVGNKSNTNVNPADYNKSLPYTTKVLPDEPVGENLPEATVFEAAGAALNQGFTAGIYDVLNAPEFDPEYGFDLNKAITDTGRTLSMNDLEFLAKVEPKSQAELDHYLAKMDNKAIADQAMSENLGGTLLGAVIDPVETLLGGAVGKVAKLGQVANMSRAASVTGAAVLGGAAAGGISLGIAQTNQRDATQIALDAVGGALGGLLEGVAITKKLNTTPPNLKATPDDLGKVDAVMGTDYSSYLSKYDRFKAYFGDIAADKFLANPMGDVGDSIATYTRDAYLATSNAQYSVEKAFMAATGFKYTDHLLPWKASAWRRTAEDFGAEVQLQLHKNHSEFLRGIPISKHPNERVQSVVDSYTKSRFAEDSLSRMKEAGVDAADQVEFSPYYTPYRARYDKMAQFVQSGRAKWDDLYNMYGKQILRIYPALAEKVSAKQAGKHYVNTLKQNFENVNTKEYVPLSRGHMELILKGLVSDKDMDNTLDTLFSMSAKAKSTPHLRKRMDWNVDEKYVTKSGQAIAPKDFLDDDFLSSLERYNRSTASAVGLARKGFPTEAALRKELDELVEQVPIEQQREVRVFVKDTEASLLNRPVGEELNKWFRAGNTVGAALNLANSGIYNIADYAKVAHEFGVVQTAKAFAKTLPKGLFKGFRKEDADTLSDILYNRIASEGRLRPIVTHLEDNFESPLGGAFAYIQDAGQYTRFLNMSEAVRRHQINMVTGLLQDSLIKMSKGDTAATDYFRGLFKDGDMLNRIRQQINKYDTKLHDWDDFEAMTYLTTQLTSATDNIAVFIRNGELPTFMAHSQVGKALFPYLSFPFAMTQKLLRRTYSRDGAVGVAGLIAMQAPFAYFATGLANIQRGQPFEGKSEQDFYFKMAQVIPTFGAAGLAIDFINPNGRGLGGVSPTFALLNQTRQLSMKALGEGEVTGTDIMRSIPLVSVFTPVRLAVGAAQEE
jgi:hypothetical protein